ncbi:MAG: helix-turn-helix domain-containing protein [Clostridium perfringens]|nr:helix-turn-helix domain-containing protein [Clostridium perfringens]
MEKWSQDEKKCPISFTLSVLGGRWKWLILYKLYIFNKLRYSELKKVIPSINYKMLSQELKELTEHNLIIREVVGEVPPKVEYSLSNDGKTVIPLLIAMSNWGSEHNKIYK